MGKGQNRQTEKNEQAQKKLSCLKKQAFRSKEVALKGGEQTNGWHHYFFFFASTTKKKLHFFFLRISQFFKLRLKKLRQNVWGTKQNTKKQA